MSPHLIESAAKAQIDDRLRYAARRRVASQARVRHSLPVARPTRERPGRRSLRAVFG